MSPLLNMSRTRCSESKKLFVDNPGLQIDAHRIEKSPNSKCNQTWEQLSIPALFDLSLGVA